MPRSRKPGGPEPKKRSRNGCWPCKTRKIKCDETHPACLSCQRQGDTCDYSIRLNWEGRGKKKPELVESSGQITFSSYVPPSAACDTRQESSFGTHMVAPFPLPRTMPAAAIEILEPAMTKPIVPTPMTRETWWLDPRYAQNYERHTFSEVSNKEHLAPTTDKCRNQVLSSLRSSYAGQVTGPTVANISYSQSFQTQDKIEKIFADNVSFDRPSKRVRSQQVSDIHHTSKIRDTVPPNGPSAYIRTSILSQTPSFRISNEDPSIPDTAFTPDSSKTKCNQLSPYSLHGADSRRLSVESLLSGPPGMGYDQDTLTSRDSISDIQSPLKSLDQEELVTWGIDRGFKDLDIGKNDDEIAISGCSPVTHGKEPEFWVDNVSSSSSAVEFGFGVQAKDTAFEGGDYYAQPIPIQIPRSFEPLPAILHKNSMNLLYFHHFISHTARILVPHHCSSNPFQNILPNMALRDTYLMSLLLAYSASHRARLLQHPEPATRIALWVQDIFPNLRHALNDPMKVMSLTSLASAIMLASLEIISPKAFGVEVPWRLHLDTARQVIAARGGWRTMNRDHSPVTDFLLRWFAYLDVLGSLVGGSTDPPSINVAVGTEYHMDETHDEYRIDCLFGFTGRCITILASIAALAHGCAADRIGPDHSIRSDWEPSEKIREQAEMLILDTEDAMLKTRFKPCPHLHSLGEATDQWDHLQMAAVNEAYHWAGLVHLHRRVLGKHSDHPDIQKAVGAIFSVLLKIKRGSTAEACLLFPMFTAGCDTQDMRQRAIILDRLLNVEQFGMSQVHKARKLMEKVWETGKPWETLLCGEFVG